MKLLLPTEVLVFVAHAENKDGMGPSHRATIKHTDTGLEATGLGKNEVEAKLMAAYYLINAMAQRINDLEEAEWSP